MKDDAAARRLRREYVARYAVNGALPTGSEPLVELAVRLHRRLDQVTTQVEKLTKVGTELMAETTRGHTAHPLLGHERELARELRQVVTELNRRHVERAAVDPLTELDATLGRTKLRAVS
jgi:23S rRNA C2498 (ribose-2'-O)-methylase RlmM